MEALVAVSLAGNVAQFVQLTTQIIQETIAIKRTGQPSSLPELQKLARGATAQAALIRSRLEASANTQSSSDEDKYLLAHAADCEDSGKDFVTYLDGFCNLQQKSTTNFLDSARTSLKLKWNHRKTQDFEAKLDRFRASLTLATTLALRASLDHSQEKVFEHLSALHESNQLHDHKMAEMHTRTQQLIEIGHFGSDNRLAAIQIHTKKCLEEVISIRKEIPKRRENDILTWLSFRQISWRYDEVPSAYAETFQWIFQPPKGAAWDDFTAHLSDPTVRLPYFVNGKAGSGKSTLMKYMLHHPKSQKELRKWVGHKKLLTVDFFFWNLGTPMQKTHLGLLRTLLHKVLQKYPELIPAVLPDLYEHWKDSYTSIEPALSEVKKAFELLTQKAASFLKLCIFIDGIDECDGNHRDMCQFLCSLSSEDVKLVISSRPITPCLRAFQACPTLRLQDLTMSDMELFVQGSLAAHEDMIQLMTWYPEEARNLITNIGKKAEGVFLWVKLVVQLLVNGLEAGDDINDLQLKLDALPPDLKDLYRRMLARMPPDYRVQAAETFQLFHTWNSCFEEQELTTLLYALATQDPSRALTQSVEPLDFKKWAFLNRNAEARIRSRSGGLLEVYDRMRLNLSDLSLDAAIDGVTVSYMHRTVAEFLISDDVWQATHDMIAQSGFNPHQNLTSACLAVVKTRSTFGDRILKQYYRNMFSLLRLTGTLNARQVSQYVEAINQTMFSIGKAEFSYKTPSGAAIELTTYWMADFYHWARSAQPEQLRRLGTHLSLAAREGLVQYLRAYGVAQTSSYLKNYAIALHALESWRDFSLVPLHHRKTTLEYILRNFVKPEDDALDCSLWRKTISTCQYLLDCNYDMEEAATLLRTVLGAAQSKLALMDGKVHDYDQGTINPWSLVQTIKTSKDLSLGRELEEYILSESPSRLPEDFIEDFQRATVVESKKKRTNATVSAKPPAPSLHSLQSLWER